MLDGTPTLRMNEFMLAGIEKGQIPLELPESEKNSAPMPSPHEVVFEMDHKLKSAVAKSYQGFGEEMAQQDLKVSLPHDSSLSRVEMRERATADAVVDGQIRGIR
jgi:carnitine O-acetyltransferase